MEDIGNGLLLETLTGRIAMENGGALLQETGGPPIVINNFLGVTAGDGISVSEKAR